MATEQSLYNLELSNKFKPTLQEVKKFIADKVLPVEEEFFGTRNKADRWALSERSLEILDDLKNQARQKGLWNFFLPDWNGEGVTNLDYAYLAAEMGKSPLSSEVFNCSAPDTEETRSARGVGERRGAAGCYSVVAPKSKSFDHERGQRKDQRGFDAWG